MHGCVRTGSLFFSCYGSVMPWTDVHLAISLLPDGQPVCGHIQDLTWGGDLCSPSNKSSAWRTACLWAHPRSNARGTLCSPCNKSAAWRTACLWVHPGSYVRGIYVHLVISLLPDGQPVCGHIQDLTWGGSDLCPPCNKSAAWRTACLWAHPGSNARGIYDYLVISLQPDGQPVYGHIQDLTRGGLYVHLVINLQPDGQPVCGHIQDLTWGGGRSMSTL